MTDNGSGSSNSLAQVGGNRQLPKKEANLFRTLVKHHDSKQYKKAIKAADAILDKYPTHGETLAMKGLTLNSMSYHTKREEAHELVKKALTHDMRSSMCWHVYGLLHKSDRNYNEAIKAYKMAQRLDPNNGNILNILKDLSNLQIQMRDLDGFVATRNAMLVHKPNLKLNWMAFAVAKHLAGDHRDAVRVIDTYLGTLTEQSDELGRGFESGELALYKNQILAEIPNNYREALEHLAACEGVVVDRTSWLMTKAEYQLALQDFGGAKRTVDLAFDRGMTENFRVHTLYMAVLLELDDYSVVKEALRLRGTQTLATFVPLSEEQRSRIRHAYATDLLPRFRNSYAVQSVPITLLSISAATASSSSSPSSSTSTIPDATTASALQEALEARCRKGLVKGVPSLCSELSSFVWVQRNGRYVRPDDPVDYASHPVFRTIVAMVDGFVACLETESKLAPSDDIEQPLTTILWAWFLRAGLYELSGEYDKGLEMVAKCLDHSPTEVDVYELKGRLLARSGDPEQAADCVEQGRELDKQDRYMNNLATQYLLRAGREEQALRTISLFAKHEGNPEQNLFDMQCSWYELEVAEHYARKQEWGRSLKKYAAVVKHFDDINEDQFDFHHYCVRRVTLRAYVDVLRFEDEAYGQEYFVRAASGMVRIYLRLLDRPTSDDSKEPDYSTMTAAERKKAKAIARKKKKAAEKKDEEEAASAAAAAAAASASAASTAAAHENSEAPGAAGTSNGTTNHHSTKPTASAAGTAKPSFVEEDPLGKELLAKDPADEARKYASMLLRYAPGSVDSWLLCYDVAVRRRKALSALRALRIAQSIDPTSGPLLWRIVDLVTKSDSLLDQGTTTKMSDPARTVFREQLSALLNNKSLESFVRGAVAAASNSTSNGATSWPSLTTSLPYRTCLAKAMVLAGTHTVAEACQVIVGSGSDGPQPLLSGLRGASVDNCQEALAVLRSFGGEHEGKDASSSASAVHAAVEQWLELVRSRYPLVSNWS